MVGTSGRTLLRLAPPVPRARSCPDLMKGVVCTSDENMIFTWPAITSCIAGPPPLYGTWVRLTPAVSLNNSAPRCWKLPTPAEA